MAGDFDDSVVTRAEERAQRAQVEHLRVQLKGLREQIETITEAEWDSGKFASHRWNRLVACGFLLDDADYALASILRVMDQMDRA
jgi:hypothetical protein